MLVTVKGRDSAPTCVYLTQLTFSTNLSRLLFHKQRSCAHLGSGCASGWERLDRCHAWLQTALQPFFQVYPFALLFVRVDANQRCRIYECFWLLGFLPPPVLTAACFNVTAGPCCSSGILNSPVICGRLWTISLAAVAQPRLPSAEIHRPGGPKPWKRWTSSSL